MRRCFNLITLTSLSFSLFKSAAIPFSAGHRLQYFRKAFFLVTIVFSLGKSSSFAQQKITGRVKAGNDLSLAGVNIFVKGSKKGVMTDTSGFFSISAQTGEVLVFSFIGYATTEIKIGNDLVVNVTLPESINNLNEVVVTGYMSEKVKDISGSVAVVKPKDLVAAAPAGQVEQMLQGRVAGLTVITSGEPGSESNIHLHGIGNFGDVTPLYIIDGVQGDLNSLNLYDVESLQVLKDAGAYSIYGVRGANGVIVVTTKKGRSGKPTIAYDFYIGETLPDKGLPILTPQQNANITWTELKNSGNVDTLGNPNHLLYGNGSTAVLPDYVINDNGVFHGYPAGATEVDSNRYNLDPNNGTIYQIMKYNKQGTDWYHQVFKPALSQNHTISVSGGMEKSHYLFSLGYLDQEGTMLNTYLKRFTARINTEFNLDNVFRMGENLQLVYKDNPKYAKILPDYTNEISRVMGMEPGLPVYDIKGKFVAYDDLNGGPQSNPVGARLLSTGNKGNNWQVFGNAYAELDFLKYFTARSSFGGSLVNYYNTNFVYGSYSGVSPNSFSESSGYARSWTWTNMLNFSKSFNNIHQIKALAGLEEISNYNRELGGSRINYIIDDPNYRFLSSGDPYNGLNNYSFASTSYLSSFISRIDYEYKNRYIFSATLRSDGSSIFGPENRFGWFPSLSIAWRAKEEKFLQESNWLTDLKLRASWGKTGFNGNTDPFNQYTLYGGNFPGDAYYDINGISRGSIQQGFGILRIGNPKTGWQQDVVTNLGLDAIFWNGKLSITADVYDKVSQGLLFPVSLPDYISGGAQVPNVNVGNLDNRGIDVLLGSRGRFSRNWGWDVSVTFSHYENKIVKLYNLPYFDANGGLVNGQTNGVVRNEIGYPIGSFFGYKVIGYFQDANDVAKSPSQMDAAPGRFKYLDSNNDGKISDADRIHMGNPNPTFTIGLNIGINFKRFDFSTFFYGSFGNDVFDAVGAYARTDKLNESWTPERGLAHTAKAPILESNSYFSTSGAINSYPLEKGSYLRNKSIMIGYTFSSNALEKIKVKRLKIYIQVVNLFTLTKYSGLDPELRGYVVRVSPPAPAENQSSFGIDRGNYPNNQIQFLVGLNLGL